MAGDIKQKIVLEGEKEYSAALKAAQRNLKTLRSELKAETAELGANATSQQKNEVKVKNLQKQIKEQEKVVKTYRQALEEVRDKYSDNEEAIAKWEQKLNDARASLADMKNQIDLTGNSFKSIADGAQQSNVETTALAFSFEKISEAGEAMSLKLEGIFSSVVGTIRETIGAVWSEIMEAAAAANQYTDLAGYFGSSAQEVQKWSNALEAAGHNMSGLTTLISQWKYGGKADKITEWFGVSDVNYTNDLEYTKAVFDAMIERREAMEAAGTWDQALSEISGGRRSQELMWYISNWETLKENLEYFDTANGGVGMDEEDLQTMNQLYLDVEKLRASWKAFKQEASAKIFGKIALDVTSNFQGALDALIAFMDADPDDVEARQKAIDDLQKNLTEAFTKIGEAVAAAAQALDEAGKGLQGSENGYVRLIGNILSAVADVLKWLGDENNLETAKHVVEGLIALWATGKALSFIAKMKSLSGYFSNIFSNRTIPTLNGGEGTGTGSGSGTGAQNVTNQTVTTQNVTTGNVSTETVSSETVTNASFTAASFTTGNTTTENVSTMYVNTMIGGNGTGNPSIPSVPSGGNDFNGFVPVLSGGDAQINLNGGDAQINLNGGDEILGLPEGEPIRLPPSDYSVDNFGGENGTPPGTTGADDAVGPLLSLLRSPVAKFLGGAATFFAAMMPDSPLFAQSGNSDAFDENGELTQEMKDLGYKIDENGELIRWFYTDEQKSAAEELWDAINEGDYEQIDKAVSDFKEAFEGQEEEMNMLLNKMSELQNSTITPHTTFPDLPSYWWHEVTDNMPTSDDISGLRTMPGQMRSAVKEGMSGVKVTMDGQTVGRLVAPYVSQYIARDLA